MTKYFRTPDAAVPTNPDQQPHFIVDETIQETPTEIILEITQVDLDTNPGLSEVVEIGDAITIQLEDVIVPEESKPIEEPKKVKEVKETKEVKEPKETKEVKEPKETKEVKEPKETKEVKDKKDKV